jgi:cytochrome c oxidase assembly factor CtaG
VGLLPAPSDALTPALARHARVLFRAGALFAAALALLPPLEPAARRYVVFESAQFALIALVLPALIVLGAPLCRLPGCRLAGCRLAVPGRARLAGSVTGRARSRLGRRGVSRAVPSLVCYLTALVFFRTPLVVGWVRDSPLLLAAELGTFAVAGSVFWSELVASPPFVPHVSGARRIAVAVPAMWSVWLLAYLVGFSRTAWFPAYRHAHGAISLIADQQLAAGVLWACASLVFVPVVFVNLMRFLSDEVDPDDNMDGDVDGELARLVPGRAERRRSAGEARARHVQ